MALLALNKVLSIKKQARISRCGNQVVVYDQLYTGDYLVAPAFCNEWECPVCGPKRLDQLRDRIHFHVQDDTLFNFLTLTSSSSDSYKELVIWFRLLYDRLHSLKKANDFEFQRRKEAIANFDARLALERKLRSEAIFQVASLKGVHYKSLTLEGKQLFKDAHKSDIDVLVSQYESFGELLHLDGELVSQEVFLERVKERVNNDLELLRSIPGIKYVSVFEISPTGHLHLHVLLNVYVPEISLKDTSTTCSRIYDQVNIVRDSVIGDDFCKLTYDDIRAVDPRKFERVSGYLTKYLTKDLASSFKMNKVVRYSQGYRLLSNKSAKSESRFVRSFKYRVAEPFTVPKSDVDGSLYDVEKYVKSLRGVRYGVVNRSSLPLQVDIDTLDKNKVTSFRALKKSKPKHKQVWRNHYDRYNRDLDALSARIVTDRLLTITASTFDWSSSCLPLTDDERVSYVNDKIEEFRSKGFHLDHRAEQVLTSWLDYNVVWVSGPAGSGKTHLVDMLVDIYGLDFDNSRVLSYTGRAVERLREVVSTSENICTLHQALNARFGGDFGRSATNIRPELFIIVDEISMISRDLFARLLLSLADNVKIMVLGDPNQLLPFKKNSVIDILDDKVFKVALVTDFRSNARVRSFSKKILAKKVSEVDFTDFDLPLIFKCINEGYRVLTNTRKLAHGINLAYHEYLNGSISKQRSNTVHFNYQIGDRVMFLKNDSRKRVKNGQIGVVVNVTFDGVDVDLGKRTVFYGNERSCELTLAYACTVHKSQGNEYERGLVILENRKDPELLNNNVLYTAVTRFKKDLVLMAKGRADIISLKCNLSRGVIDFPDPDATF